MSGDIERVWTPYNVLGYAASSCLERHRDQSTRTDGSASFTLPDASVLIPDPAKPDEIEAHRKRLTLEPLRTAELCGSCHRSFSGQAIGNQNHLPGIDDLGDWASSGFAGAVTDHLTSVDPQSCQGCHMQSVTASEAEMAGANDGRISSHRWAASHTSLAAQLPDAGHREQARNALEAAVIVDIGAVRAGQRRYVLPSEAQLRGGEPLIFGVLLQNDRVGHRFPGGVRDLHEAWVEVEVRDASGALLAVSRPGLHDTRDVFVLRATVLDASASPELLHQVHRLSLIHISEPTRLWSGSRMPSSA